VEYSAPEGGRFDCENPQRFSNRFVGHVANVNDVVQFYRKKATLRRTKTETEVPDESVIAQITLDSIKVEKLVKEFLSAQPLTILPQNSFGDAISQFVDKDDKHAMEMFVNDSLSNQVKHLLTSEEADDDTIAEEMDKYRAKLEELFANGVIKRKKPTKLKPKPDTWDSDLDGPWEDQAGAVVRSEDEEENDDSNFGSIAPKPPASRGRGRGRGGRAAATTSTRKTTKQTTSGRGTRGKKQIFEEDSEEEESDVVMVDDDEEEEEEEEELFVRPKATSKKATSKPETSTRSSAKAEPVKKPATRQSTLNFAQPTSRSTQSSGTKKSVIELSDEISDDDAFEPVSSTTKPKVRR
jgi:double-strand break repair protein MRE11